jgi:hypothetical protein
LGNYVKVVTPKQTHLIPRESIVQLIITDA